MFDKRLKKLRLEQGWKQKDLAEKLGMATSTIGMYERGLRQPDTDTLTKFSILFNVSSDYLLGISDKRDHSDLTEKDKKIYQELSILLWNKLKITKMNH